MSETPVRRDAARNRERLLTAARTVVSESGPDVPLDEIARAAGVSRTTLHRHFVDREALAAAVLQENVEEIEARATALAGVGGGAAELFHHVLEVQLRTPWLAHMAARGRSRELGELAERTKAAFGPLMEQARETGESHPGTTADDILLALPMMMAVVAVDGRSDGRGGLARARGILHRGLFTTPPPDDASLSP